MSTEFIPREREIQGILFKSELPESPRLCKGCYFAGNECKVDEMQCWTIGPAIIWVKAQEEPK